MRTRLLTGLLLLASCQSARPSEPDPTAPVPPALFSRFQWEGLEPESSVLQPIHVLGTSREADEEGVDAPAALIEFNDVLASVEQHFPLILAAEEEIEIAEGKLLRARGGFDTQLGVKSRFDFTGFYENERADAMLEQPTALWGATFEGGYRLGTGDFAVYDGKAKTNLDGEFRFGISLPLLRGRAIDKRRVAFWSAELERRRADPALLAKRLDVTRKAADSYWKWVSAGRLREVAVRLLALAEDRRQQVEFAVEEGLLAPINLTENQRLIVDRRASLLSAERSLQEAAILLSLYWRDEEGRAAVPPDSALPYEFPVPRAPKEILVGSDESFAVTRRPELMAVQLELQKLGLDRDLAENALLPKLDVGVYASQDVGGSVSTPDDKEELELQARVSLQVPLQRREAKGKAREISAKLTKLELEARYLRDLVVNEVRDARSALVQSWLSIEQASQNVSLANELADAERFQLGVGESDLLRVNLREQQAAVAAAKFVDVLRKYFRSVAEYRAVLGVPYDEVVQAGVAPSP